MSYQYVIATSIVDVNLKKRNKTTQIIKQTKQISIGLLKGINQLRRSFFNQDELPSGRLIGNRLKKYENSQSRLKDRFSIIKFFTDKFRSHTTQPTKQVNYGGIIYAQLITHDTSNRYKYQAYGKETIDSKLPVTKHNKYVLTFFR